MKRFVLGLAGLMVAGCTPAQIAALAGVAAPSPPAPVASVAAAPASTPPPPVPQFFGSVYDGTDFLIGIPTGWTPLPTSAFYNAANGTTRVAYAQGQSALAVISYDNPKQFTVTQFLDYAMPLLLVGYPGSTASALKRPDGSLWGGRLSASKGGIPFNMYTYVVTKGNIVYMTTVGGSPSQFTDDMAAQIANSFKAK